MRRSPVTQEPQRERLWPAVVTELNATGTALAYSSYAVGASVDTLIFFDTAGNYYTASATKLFDLHILSEKPSSGPTCVVNAASHLQAAIAPGEVISIFGWNIGPDTPVVAQPDASGKMPA